MIQFRIGYEFTYTFPQPTPCLMMLNVHYSRVSDLLSADSIIIRPSSAVSGYRDLYGNWCTRMVAPAGKVTISANATIRDSGLPDATLDEAHQVPVEFIPDDALVYLLPSRFCESDELLDVSWELFGKAKPGLARVRAICDFVQNRIHFDYMKAQATRTAKEAYEERVGVCRDYAHLAIAFCRALNIPARYCTGYLSDAGTPRPYPPGDFAAYMEVYLGGKWITFDPRNNEPRIGRILIARGRDAADVAMVTTFGPNTLDNFRVWTDET